MNGNYGDTAREINARLIKTDERLREVIRKLDRLIAETEKEKQTDGQSGE